MGNVFQSEREKNGMEAFEESKCCQAIHTSLPDQRLQNVFMRSLRPADPKDKGKYLKISLHHLQRSQMGIQISLLYLSAVSEIPLFSKCTQEHR